MKEADDVQHHERCPQREWYQDGLRRWPWLPHSPFEDRRQRSFNLQLERLVQEIVRRLLKAQVCFWLDQGTLLSAWRHGTPVLRYDTDVDMGILLDDVDIGLNALAESSKLGTKDWRRGDSDDARIAQASHHVEVFWLTSPTARCDLYLYKQEGNMLTPMEPFLTSSPRELLLPLQLFRWRGLTLPCPSQPDRWLTTTEPEIYREWDIAIASKMFDWDSLRYVTVEDNKDGHTGSVEQPGADRPDPFSHFDFSLLVWLPDAALLSRTAQSLLQQDSLNQVWDIRAIGASRTLERQLLARLHQLPAMAMTTSRSRSRSWSASSSAWQMVAAAPPHHLDLDDGSVHKEEMLEDLRPRCEDLNEAPSKRPRVICLWDSRGNYSWRRLTVQLAPLVVEGSPVQATRLPSLNNLHSKQSKDVTQCIRVDPPTKTSGIGEQPFQNDNRENSDDANGGEDVDEGRSRSIGLELRPNFASKAEHAASMDSSWVAAAVWNGCIPLISQDAWLAELPSSP